MNPMRYSAPHSGHHSPPSFSDIAPWCRALTCAGRFRTEHGGELAHEVRGGVAAAQAVTGDARPAPVAGGPSGCGVMAGRGAAVYSANERTGRRVALCGSGGGRAAPIGPAVNGGARQVIAVDVDPRKLQWARN